MKYLFVLLFLGSSFTSFAQNKQKSIALTFGIGGADIRVKNGWVGTPSYSGKSFHTIGLNYTHQFTKFLYLETGINYLNHKFEATPVFYPGTPQAPSTGTVSLLDIPIKARLQLGKYFYLNGGPILDFELENSNYTTTNNSFSGVGATIGAGVQYVFGKKFLIFANPQLNFHNVILKKSGPYYLYDNNITFGFGYRIK